MVRTWPRKIPRICSRVLLYILMIALSVLFIYPFLYMLITSLKSNEDLYSSTVVWIPRTLYYQNYEMAVKITNYFQYAANSLLVTLPATLGQLISCSMVGYGLARFRFPGRGILTVLAVLAMLVPAHTIIVSQYLMYSNLGWINTYLPFIVPSFLGCGFNCLLYTSPSPRDA